MVDKICLPILINNGRSSSALAVRSLRMLLNISRADESIRLPDMGAAVSDILEDTLTRLTRLSTSDESSTGEIVIRPESVKLAFCVLSEFKSIRRLAEENEEWQVRRMESILDTCMVVLNCRLHKDHERLCSSMLRATAAYVSDEYFDQVLSKVRMNTCVDFRVNMLCCLVERLLAGKQDGAIDDDLFRTIQKGLVHKDNSTRKQSLYVLKRMVEAIANGDCHPVSDMAAAASVDSWSDFFVIIESLDEKQVHIVQQVVAKLDKMLEERSLHPSWVLVLFETLFKHQNTAVARWGVSYFLKSGTRCADDAYFAEFVAAVLLPFLNNASLYGKSSVIKKELQDFMTSCLQQESIGRNFFNVLLTAFCRIPWGPIPLFHVSHALRAVAPSDGQELSESTVSELVSFVTVSLRCQEPLLRCGTQCNLLRILTSSSPRPKDFLTAASQLKAFHGPGKVLLYGTRCWDDAKNWLLDGRPSNPDWEKLLGDLPAGCSVEIVGKLALGYALYAGENWARSDFIVTLQNDLADSLCRPYDQGTAKKLAFLHCLLQSFAIPQKRRGRDFLLYGAATPLPVVTITLNPDLIDLLIKEYRSADDEAKRGMMLDLILSLPFQGAVVDLVRETATFAMGGTPEPGKRQLLKCNLLNGALRVLGPSRDLVISVLDPELFIQQCVLSKEPDLPRKERIILDAMKWNILAIVLGGKREKSMDVSLKKDSTSAILSRAVSVSSECPDGDHLSFVLGAVEEVVKLTRSVDPDIMIDLLNRSHVSVFEHRKNESFWPALKAFVDLLTTEYVLLNPSEQLQACLGDVVKSLLQEAEVVPGIAATLAPALATTLGRTNGRVGGLPDCLKRHVGKILTFGPIFRKDLLQVMDANVAVQQEADELLYSANCVEGSDHAANVIVRATMNNLIAKIEGEEAVNDVLDSLLAHEASLSLGKARYFANSIVHLTKLRVLQSLLMLVPRLKHAGASKVFHWIANSIVKENLEAGLRYLSEWILALILINHWEQLNKAFWDSYEVAKATRLTCIPSFIAVRAFAAMGRRGAGRAEELSHALSFTAPWCMAQHFATRTCAQVFVRRLHAALQAEDRTASAKFHLLMDMVEGSFSQGDKDKNAKKVKDDFYLSHFDPVKCFNFRDVFVELPRLCGVIEQEWQHFKTWKDAPSVFKAGNGESVFQHVKGGGEGSGELDMMRLSQELRACDLVQKKITPWKAMFDSESHDEAPTAAFPDLIVLASMIDKLPNLGGLCRTCEIFGAGQLVLPSVKVLAHHELQSVAVTAHAQLASSGRVSEVCPAQVAEYLSRMREEGYSVVAAEQSDKSSSLVGFDFPERTVLLLGNEKEGLPVDLLGLVDHCVEIPQHGVVRSLNVHVTGAIMIWEYARQWSDKSKRKTV